MATSARRSISLCSLRRRAEKSAAMDILSSYLFFPTFLPTGNRNQILGDHAPAHITLESTLSFIAGSPHRERIFQMADGRLAAGSPAQRSLKPTFFLPLCAGLRQTARRWQGHFLDSQSLRFPLVLGGEKSAGRGGHLWSLSKRTLGGLDGWQPRVPVFRVPLQNFVTPHDALLHLIHPHRPTNIVRLHRLSLVLPFV